MPVQRGLKFFRLQIARAGRPPQTTINLFYYIIVIKVMNMPRFKLHARNFDEVLDNLEIAVYGLGDAFTMYGVTLVSEIYNRTLR